MVDLTGGLVEPAPSFFAGCAQPAARRHHRADADTEDEPCGPLCARVAGVWQVVGAFASEGVMRTTANAQAVYKTDSVDPIFSALPVFRDPNP